MLEAVFAYRELVKAYRDMLGKYDALAASRKKSHHPKFDTAKGSGTIAAQLQGILDSMQKNATAEEAFLDSVVGYNTAFAKLERMKGTLFYKGAEKEKTE